MKPNVLFLLSDDQSYFARGRYCKHIVTPTLDRLAAQGCDVARCFCASPVCSPARASLLTGLMPSGHGVHDWIISGSVDIDALPPFSRSRPPIRDNEDRAIDYLAGLTTYTDILADNGYDIALSGKWHLGDTFQKRRGYTYWNTILRGGCRYTAYDLYKGGVVTGHTDYLTDRIADNAIDYLKHGRTEKPFYLGVHFTAPHTPWDREEHPKEIWDLYEGVEFEDIPSAPIHRDQMKNPFTGDTPQRRQELIRGYFTAVTAMDRAIGRILAALEELSLEEDTIVIFTSDNGMNVGQHGVWGKGNGTYPQNFYEESIRVPLILRVPGKESREVNSLVSHLDLFPTILELCGIQDPREEPQGSSFASALDGKPFSRKWVSVSSEYGAVRMLRDDRYKYIRNYVNGDNQLYDLLSDPGETRNLHNDPDSRELLRQMEEMMDESFRCWDASDRSGRHQFPRGMGQQALCAGTDGHSPYRQDFEMYYE